MLALRMKTLMWREWLQNRWTWLVVIAVLPGITLVTLPFGHVGTPSEVKMAVVPFVGVGASALTCVMLAWATVLFMSTGLARRDQQDRSIEFWMSLPGRHVEHVGAQYLMHALFFPALALVGGLLLGLLIAPVVVVKLAGVAALGDIPWLTILGSLAQPVAVALVALLFAAVWLAPVVLTLMAASIWFKRLALPALLIASVFLANWGPTASAVRALAQDYGQRIGHLVEGVTAVFLQQMVSTGVQVRLDDGEVHAKSAGEFLATISGDLASVPFAVALLVGAAALAALLYRRARV